jgi:arylsulfatase A-like enzyme
MAVSCGILLVLSCTRPPEPPSIVFILIDTLRADFLGSYGFEGPVSPQLDALARESHLFEHCYAQAPWTKPSMASLFCSLHPLGHGVTNHEGRMWGRETEDLVKGVLAEEAVTLAEVLQEGGYRTAGFVANPWMTAEYGFHQGFDVYEDVTGDPKSGIKVPADSVLAQARGWLSSIRPAERFFLYLHFMEVHAPYDSPNSYYELVRGSPGLASDDRITLEEFKWVPIYMRQPYWVVDEQASLISTWRGRYAAGIRHLDQTLAPFLEELQSSGRLENTWLVITSDHGEEIHEHGGWDHGRTLYEHQIHVPLLLRPPGGLEEPRRHEDLVRLIDLMPTLLARAGLAGPSTMEGDDLSPLLAGEPVDVSGVSFATGTNEDPGLYSLNVGKYKLILNILTNQYLLFDLEEDPGETGENLGQLRPRLAQEMLEHLKRFVESQEDRDLFAAPTRPVSEERKARLRSLGYVN